MEQSRRDRRFDAELGRRRADFLEHGLGLVELPFASGSQPYVAVALTVRGAAALPGELECTVTGSSASSSSSRMMCVRERLRGDRLQILAPTSRAIMQPAP